MNYHIEFDLDFKRNEFPGCFIALEGIDGSGKSTQAEALRDVLTKQGRTVILKHPFEGEIGGFVRKILAGEKKVPPVALQHLISANRNVQQVEIIESLKNGTDVIIDRYFWSAVAYGILDVSGEANEQTANQLLIGQSILSMYHQFLMPDITFYLKISPKTAMERLSDMEKELEIYESEAKIRKISEIYDWLLKQFPKEFRIIDGEKPVEEVTEQMAMLVASRK
ncbi:MAG TPA: dTMP kinase [Patescibacteria group bacterium]|nr:dTMP kinase [Patescibacteria group bacterium]